MRLLTILFLVTSFLQVNAQSFNDITIKKDKASLETVFLEIEKQSEFRFFFNETLMKQAVPVTIDVKKVSLEKTLEVCFKMQPLTYAIVKKTIIARTLILYQNNITATLFPCFLIVTIWYPFQFLAFLFLRFRKF